MKERPSTFSSMSQIPPLEVLRRQVNELTLKSGIIKREKDFYYGKLEEIENVCNEKVDNHRVLQEILDILHR